MTPRNLKIDASKGVDPSRMTKAPLRSERKSAPGPRGSQLSLSDTSSTSKHGPVGALATRACTSRDEWPGEPVS